MTRLQNSFLTTFFFKKLQNQPLEVQKQSPEVFYKKKIKKVFLKISQTSQENTCVEAFFVVI